MALDTGFDVTRLILGCILMWVVTRHAAKLVITLDKALALCKTIRLKTISRLLGKFVKLRDCCRRPVAFPARVINNLAALIGEFIQ